MKPIARFDGIFWIVRSHSDDRLAAMGFGRTLPKAYAGWVASRETARKIYPWLVSLAS